MNVSREIQEGEQEQGVNEQIVYTLTTTPWGSSPSAVAIKVYQVNEATQVLTDVTATIMPGTPPAPSGDIISTATIKAMTANALYRVDVRFTCSGNIFEPYAYIRCRP